MSGHIFPLAALALLALAGCANVAKEGTLLRAEATLQRNEATLGDIETHLQLVGDVQTEIRADVQTQIGGGVDSITSWLAVGGLVLIALGMIAAAYFYPVVLRPIRLRREQREREKNGERNGTIAQHSSSETASRDHGGPG